MVQSVGLEPTRVSSHAPQTCVSTNSTTTAFSGLAYWDEASILSGYLFCFCSLFAAGAAAGASAGAWADAAGAVACAVGSEGTVGAAGVLADCNFSIKPVLPDFPCITVKTIEVIIKIPAAA